jgi:3-hydroxy-9,10-secoandrosta-1,3,5(10)-triene-9,17-dione monooxygenase
MRLTIAHVVGDCRKVVRDVMEGSGASVHYLDHELSRISRDVQMMGAHTVFDLDLVAEQCGRALLDANEPLF